MAERELTIHGSSIEDFRGQRPEGLEEIVRELRLIYSDSKCLLFESPTPGRYLKYVIDPGTHKPLDEWLQTVVLRGLRNQMTVSDVPGVQEAFGEKFYGDIPGLFELEFVEGTPLSAYTEANNRRRLTPDEVEFVGLSTYGVISTINDRGIMHRDVKPGNIILLSPCLATKLIDWSLAANKWEHKVEQIKGRILGTPPFFRLDNDEFGVRDRYGLGLTLLQAVASNRERQELDVSMYNERDAYKQYKLTLQWIEQVLKRTREMIPKGLYEMMDAFLHPENNREKIDCVSYKFATRDTAVARPAARARKGETYKRECQIGVS